MKGPGPPHKRQPSQKPSADASEQQLRKTQSEARQSEARLLGQKRPYQQLNKHPSVEDSDSLGDSDPPSLLLNPETPEPRREKPLGNPQMVHKSLTPHYLPREQKEPPTGSDQRKREQKQSEKQTEQLNRSLQ